MKVGDYVRTREFGINRIKCFDNGEPILENGFTALQNSGYKSSSNIIDLIEEGDYVNGWKITTVDKRNHKLYVEYDDGYLIQTISKKNIKSVVTKEQFSSMEYKVGDR